MCRHRVRAVRCSSDAWIEVGCVYIQWRFVTDQKTSLAEIAVNIGLLKCVDINTVITTWSIYMNSGSFILIEVIFFVLLQMSTSVIS